MKVEFKSSFARDLRKIKEVSVKSHVGQVIGQVEKAHSLHDIENLKKIAGADKYYRVRIGDYRIGLIFENETVIFVRLLHRKDIYRYYP